ncbi:hypothetical protein IZ6_16180 [Terrihabitans soli]|uniref:Uncharacterized protein n=1 Tax=Terrihabitans soli TaxID=708113 RepID=A0A6S6QI33_9HYPH|nr:hypothetical protein [Terrihabitans soli]BCJ90883.1 hypothetical protein IZ6_16180 [Terrihabitans soli]
MTITFLNRTEPKNGEVTIRITQDAGSILGEVTCPGGLAGSGTAAELDHDGALGVHQALASAIALAGKNGNRIGVIDAEGHWRPEWGDLVEENA